MGDLKANGVIGLDIGGANLKAVHSDGCVRCEPFALWERPSELPAALRSLLDALPSANRLAITMTGELCDCFATKAEGVNTILDAVSAATDPTRVRVFQTDGRFVSIDAARAEFMKTAAANWMALATLAARECGRGLLIDIGSTTTDIIPLRTAAAVPRGRTDPERLATGELVYSGVRRTPLCALIRKVPWRGGHCRVAAELFATTLDVYLHTGDLPENPDDCSTADHRPATKAAARARLARMICADQTLVSDADVDAIVATVVQAQLDVLRSACGEVSKTLGSAPDTIVVSGSGEFLTERLLDVWSSSPPKVVALSSRYGPSVSVAACAFALVQIAPEEAWQ